MKKEYPDRIFPYDGHGKEWDDICECGHGWEYHDPTFKEVGIMIFSFGLLSKGFGHCKTCLCSKYNRDKDNPSKRRVNWNKTTGVDGQ